MNNKGLKNSEFKVPDVSVIIPCYRQIDEIEDCIESIISQTTERTYEIIVVNSEPSVRLKEMLKGKAGVKMVSGSDRLYPACARNLGASHALADILVFFDSDVIVDSHWLSLVYDKFKEGYYCIAGAVKNSNYRNPIEFIDNILQFSDFSPSVESHVTNILPVCNIAIKKSVFKDVGGFREFTYTSGEDVKFCEELSRLYPSKMYFFNSLTVIHKGRPHFGSFLCHQYYFGFSRGYLGLLINDNYRQLGRNFFMLTPVVIKRFIYIMISNLKSKPLNVFYLILFLPVLLSGLVSWAWGFYRGCATQ